MACAAPKPHDIIVLLIEVLHENKHTHSQRKRVFDSTCSSSYLSLLLLPLHYLFMAMNDNELIAVM